MEEFVFETQDFEVQTIEEFIALVSCSAAGLGKMMCAMELNNQPFGGAIKIDNIFADTVLPLKFSAKDAVIPH